MRTFLLALLFTSLPYYCLADMIAVYSAGNENLTLSYRDDRHIRVDRSSGGYSVINGSRAVAVMNQGNGNIVLDVDQMAGMLEGLAGNQQVSIPASSDVRLTDTGEFRQIGGYRGKIYQVSDGKGVYRVALSNHPRVIAASDAIRHFFRRFATAMRNEQGARILALDYTFRNHPDRGLLHVEGGIQLVSISEAPRPDNFYALPVNNFNLSLPGLTR